MLSGPRRRRWVMVRLIALPLIVLGLASTILLGTRFVPINQARGNAGLDIDDFVAKNLPVVAAYVADHAQGLVDVTKAIAADTGSAKRYGNPSGTGKFAIPVSFSGLVREADDNVVTVVVEGLPDPGTVPVAVGAAVNGAALRDVTGQHGFSDFASQTEYQRIANRFKSVLRLQLAAAHPAVGQPVKVKGVLVTGSNPVVTPTAMETGP